ncbi:LysR family transcriptional regulator [Amycolatopsis sp. lyj-90]|uniref:LysR family transcriptional regulator n=1 Tax=Amycolatopsis sp. lyj-90 TaxID=2789285 RepID=UPI003978BC67
MDTRRLHFLLELSRHGSMRAVADVLGTTTSTVSQQIAVLAKETGAPLLEPDGRRVRLTPAGRRLAEHAVTILAAVEAARADLDPHAEPVGTVRVAGFATAVRRSVLPAAAVLAERHPRVQLRISEYEPYEAFAALLADDIDLALTYDFDLAPEVVDPMITASPLWTARWSLAVPEADAADHGSTVQVFEAFRDHGWIVNSRNSADEDVILRLASTARFAPRVTHRADSLELVEDLIATGPAPHVGLLPADRSTKPGVVLLPLAGPEVRLRAFACTRRGREAWPPLALVLRLLVR